MNNYQDILDYLYEQLPIFQRKGAAAYKDNLDNTHTLDAWYGHPHQNFRSIHVAGTNGKGSSSHMLASILQEAGYKVGLYTSPHLKDFRERIRVNGEMVSEQAVINFVNNFIERREKEEIYPSFFELTVAMAFDYFAKEKVDIAVIEVGLGGRLDSTNIIVPEVSVITNIGLDHTALLGNTLTQIAGEKGGIIKNETPVVVGEIHPETQGIFEKIAVEKNAAITFAEENYQIYHPSIRTKEGQLLQVEQNGSMIYGDLLLELQGAYQSKNILTVLSAIDELNKKDWKIDKETIRKGLANVIQNTNLMGRWQKLGADPLIICDTGHNVAGVTELVEQIEKTPHQQLHIVLGMVNDKDVSGVLELLPKNAIYYFCKADIPRALEADEMQKVAAEFNLIGAFYPSVKDALDTAISAANQSDMIFVGGSTFVVAEVV